MTSSDRIPCINPRCRRTAPAAKYDPGTKIICRKCFRSLPEDLRSSFRRISREVRKWQRRVARTSDELKRRRMKEILGRHRLALDRTWETMRGHLTAPEKPDGLESFLQENGIG